LAGFALVAFLLREAGRAGFFGGAFLVAAGVLLRAGDLAGFFAGFLGLDFAGDLRAGFAGFLAMVILEL
jgi:hypothetical protein